MKALICRSNGSFDQLAIEQTMDVPTPGPGQALIRVRAASVTFVDALQVLGRYQLRVEPPFVPGCELAGIVERAGPGVENLVPGTAIATVGLQGAFAEFALVNAAECVRLRDGMPLHVAVDALVAYATALHALRNRAHLQRGERLLVLGAGGRLGLAAVDIGRALGASVIGAAGGASKRAAARQQGAIDCIDYGQPDWHRAARTLAGGAFDVVFDPVGGSYSEPALRALGFRGRHLVIGFTAGEIPKLATNLALLMERSVLGVNFGLVAQTDRTAVQEVQQQVMDQIVDGTLQPLAPRLFRLEDVPSLLRSLVDRKLDGKAVIEFL